MCKQIGFKTAEARKIIQKGVLSPEQVSESIRRFILDAENKAFGSKRIHSYLGLLMEELLNGGLDGNGGEWEGKFHEDFYKKIKTEESVNMASSYSSSSLEQDEYFLSAQNFFHENLSQREKVEIFQRASQKGMTERDAILRWYFDYKNGEETNQSDL